MTKAVTYVEIDLDYCALDYGVAPCLAEIGVTGDRKCFNTLGTCQSRAQFTNDPRTIRFSVPADYLPLDPHSLPCIEAVSYSPPRLAMGKDMGQRGSVTVSMRDFRHADTGPGGDKYRTERPYDPFEKGTFFGKFRARQPYLTGRPMRLIRGFLGQDLSEMETRHFIMEGFTGPDSNGRYSVVGKDVLKLADGDKAQAPRASGGSLIADIDDEVTSLSLTPSDIGDEDYPASGFVAIGGKEIVAFSRTGNAMTITRGQMGTLPQSHSAGDRVQLVLQYAGADPADIIYDLIVNYAGVPAEYIPIEDWRGETAAHLRRLYSRDIAEPESVRKLIDGLIEQAALALWWDDIGRTIRLQVLRAIPDEAAALDQDVYIENSFTVQEQPGSRISQVWTYFGQINPLRPADEPDNYRSTDVRVDLQSEANYGSPAIHKIFAAWIPPFGQQTAFRLGDLQLGRFINPPRKLGMKLFRTGPVMPQLGVGYRVSGWPIQNDIGDQVPIPAQITRLEPRDDGYILELEEANFVRLDGLDDIDRVITIDGDINNVNAWHMHNLIFPPPDPEDPPTVTIIIDTNVVIGATNAATPAFDVGLFPSYIKPFVIIRGRIQGIGGRGGNANYGAGQMGGTAFYTRVPVDIQFETGARIFGGGGGGGAGGNGSVGIGGDYTGGGGGGGAGRVPGLGGAPTAHSAAGDPGTLDLGGRGGQYGGYGFLGETFLRAERAGRGGAPGMPGGVGQLATGPGGAAGRSFDGWSYCDTTGSADIRGPQVN